MYPFVVTTQKLKLFCAGELKLPKVNYIQIHKKVNILVSLFNVRMHAYTVKK